MLGETESKGVKIRIQDFTRALSYLYNSLMPQKRTLFARAMVENH